MKKLLKKISILLTFVMVLTMTSTTSVFAKGKTKYVATSFESYYGSSVYDENYNVTGYELKLSYKTKYTYDKKGNKIKDENTSYYSDEVIKSTNKYTYDKKGLLTKAVSDDGTYNVYDRDKSGKLKSVKAYSAKKKLVSSDTFTYSKGKISKVVTKTGKKKTYEAVYKNGIITTSKYWNDKGQLISTTKYDKHENATEYKSINYDEATNKKTGEDVTTYKNTYKKGKLSKTVSISSYNYGGTAYNYKEETIYFTTGKSAGEMKTMISYSETDGKYKKDSEVNYSYKYDKHGNLVQILGTDAATKDVRYKYVYKYKAIK